MVCLIDFRINNIKAMTKEEILEKASDFEDEDEFVKCDRLPFTEELWLLHQLVYIGLSCTYTGRGYIIEKLKD